MSEWWTYRPSDFLMFDAGTYWRLFELHNQAWWPAPVLLVLAGGGLLTRLAWGRSEAGGWLRGLAAILAGGWAFSGWAFVMRGYAPINWAAEILAWASFLPALALAALALREPPVPASTPVRWQVGLLLMAWAVVAHPLLAPLQGRPLMQAEVWLLTPDPTAVATLGWLLGTRPGTERSRWTRSVAWAAAVAGCIVSAATLWTLGSAQGWVMAAAVVAALAARRSSVVRSAGR